MDIKQYQKINRHKRRISYSKTISLVHVLTKIVKIKNVSYLFGCFNLMKNIFYNTKNSFNYIYLAKILKNILRSKLFYRQYDCMNLIKAYVEMKERLQLSRSLALFLPLKRRHTRLMAIYFL